VSRADERAATIRQELHDARFRRDELQTTLSGVWHALKRNSNGNALLAARAEGLKQELHGLYEKIAQLEAAHRHAQALAAGAFLSRLAQERREP
jgi:hypothetical protein